MRSCIRVNKMLWIMLYLDNLRRIDHSFPYPYQVYDGSRKPVGNGFKETHLMVLGKSQPS
jgi:hypothetical protein